MQAGSDQFLAGAPFTDDEHRLFQRRDLRHLLHDLEKRGRFPEQPVLIRTHAVIPAER